MDTLPKKVIYPKCRKFAGTIVNTRASSAYSTNLQIFSNFYVFCLSNLHNKRQNYLLTHYKYLLLYNFI